MAMPGTQTFVALRRGRVLAPTAFWFCFYACLEFPMPTRKELSGSLLDTVEEELDTKIWDIARRRDNEFCLVRDG